MRKENTMTVGQWCGQWFIANRPKWNGNTEGGYRNLIYSHICGGAWTKQHGNSLFHTTQCGSAMNQRRRDTKQPLCAWDNSSVT